MISAARFGSFLFKRGETLQIQSYRQKQILPGPLEFKLKWSYFEQNRLITLVYK